MPTRAFCLVVGVSAILLAADGVTPEERGHDLFIRRCSGCHSLDLNKEGPRLGGVYGRKVASEPKFAYSGALRKLQFRWDEAQLDRWLQNPESVAPNNDMEFRLTDARERTLVITYLKSLDMKNANKP